MKETEEDELILKDELVESEETHVFTSQPPGAPRLRVWRAAAASELTSRPRARAHAEIQGQMRTYQIEALNWMISLYDQKSNGILADEMVSAPAACV